MLTLEDVQKREDYAAALDSAAVAMAERWTREIEHADDLLAIPPMAVYEARLAAYGGIVAAEHLGVASAGDELMSGLSHEAYLAWLGEIG